MPTRRSAAAAVATTSMVGAIALTALSGGSASAVACTGQVRYATSTNTIYLTSGEVNLPDLASICPAAASHLAQTGPGTGIWDLTANLVVQSGATLHISGGAAGPVDTLRLSSPASSTTTTVVAIIAQYGHITFSHTAVTSHDPTTGLPDTDTDLPAGVATGGRARAFIRAVSYLEGAAKRQSRIDFSDSDIGYLGWYDAESYGVSYKARGCDATKAGLKLCAALDVFGSQIRSRFHHNYMGTYTYNARSMVFDHSEYDNNTMYGLDPHDDSDYLTITNNAFHDNGDHGVICSQRCDHLRIVGNESYRNGIPPFAFPGDTDLSNNQIHGIMIHRGVTRSLIARNYVHDQPNGAGIAVFDSMHNTIRNNRVETSKYGLRVSVGSHDIAFSANTVSNSSSYAVFAYPGISDSASYGTRNSHPTGVTFTGNTFTGSGSSVFRLTASDRFTFSRNRVAGTVGAVQADASKTLVWQGAQVPSTGILLTATNSPTTAVVRSAARAFPVTLDRGSRLDVVSGYGRIYAAGAGRTTVVTRRGSVTRVVGTSTPATAAVTVTPLALQVIPDSGRLAVRAPAFGSATKRIVVSAGTPRVRSRFVLGGLTPGTTYRVTSGRALHASRTANRAGKIAFARTETSRGRHVITVAAA